MRRTDTLRTITLTLLILFAAGHLDAAAARKGWTKIELSHADGESAPISEELLAGFGAELIADYEAYAIVYVPSESAAALEEQAGKENLRFRLRDDLDVLDLPGATVDVREGIKGVPANKLAGEYAAGTAGLYVLQFAAPLRAEWMDALRTLGWTLSRYVPNNGYLLVGTPSLVAQTRELPYVQWLDYYHPYQKAAFFAGDGQSHDQLFELAEGPGAESAIEAIGAVADGKVEIQQTSLDTRVYARMSDAVAEELLRHEMILSVSPKPEGQVSDERQVMSLTSNLNATQSMPTNPGNYWSWVQSRCAECSNMPASAWKVGLADTGLDDGANGSGGHFDLSGRKFFGIAGYDGGPDPLCAPGRLLCDANGHGTIVAGIAVGSGNTGDINGPYKDSLNFRLGLGVAPTAGVYITKIFSGGGTFNSSRLFDWSSDAANAGVTVQNHSWNEYSQAQSGRYSTVSRDYDIATRDADGIVNFTRRPILFSISSGNTNQGTNSTKYLALPGATAKNVLSMGGLENYRPDVGLCSDTRGDSFRNIMKISRVGTAIPGYIKPDLMAPASLIVSAHTSVLWPTPSVYCLGAFGGHYEYTGTSGTSFAAPVGAAAALIVKRYLGTSPLDISPALTKAVLIAGARSVRGGEDRTHDATTTIGAMPNEKQGFGRLTLEDILNNAQKPFVLDQSFARTFTAAGQSFSTTVRVRDASKPVKIALVWTDTPATAFTTNPLVNDLNLEVRRSSNPSAVFVGNSLSVLTEAKGEESVAWPSSGSLPYDNKNNVEFARLFLNAGEDITITVKAWNIAGDTNEVSSTFEQDFALAVLNAGEVCEPGAIVQQPQSQTIIPGQTATVSVAVSGSGPYNYQWYQAPSGVYANPVGINLPSYTTFPLATTTQFWVEVNNTCAGTFLNSNAATITVQCTAAPVIAVQPVSHTINPGQSVTLSVAATQAVSYQWYSGTSPGTMAPIAGATAPSLTVSPASTLSYMVRVSNGCGVTASVTVTVCVLPAITAQPTPRTINPGQPTTLTVTATNATTYQWYQGTAPSTTTPVGTNSPSLTVTPAVTTNYWVRLSNACGSVNSNTATVTVVPIPPPQITRLQSSFALANSQTSITGTWPQPTQAGTFLVAVISGDKDPSFNWTAPAGWVQANTYEWNHVKASVYYRPNNPGARTSETFTLSPGFHDQTLYLLEYSGVLAVNPLDRTAINGDFTNTGFLQTGFTPNTTQAKELVITVLSTYANTSFSTVPADGYAEVYDKIIGNHLTTAMYEKITNAIGSYGHNANVGVPNEWVGLVVTFKAANP
jgi:hypothetical protein